MCSTDKKDLEWEYEQITKDFFGMRNSGWHIPAISLVLIIAISSLIPNNKGIEINHILLFSVLIGCLVISVILSYIAMNHCYSFYTTSYRLEFLIKKLKITYTTLERPDTSGKISATFLLTAIPFIPFILIAIYLGWHYDYNGLLTLKIIGVGTSLLLGAILICYMGWFSKGAQEEKEKWRKKLNNGMSPSTPVNETGLDKK